MINFINPAIQLEGGLRRAFEDFMGDTVSGPWDDLIESLAGAILEGELGLERAARINLLLARTQGVLSLDRCDTCHCPRPDMVHPCAV